MHHPARAEEVRPSTEIAPIRVSFRVGASMRYRHVAIGLVATLIARVATADRAFYDEMLTAFSEAFNNVVLRGHRDRADGMLGIEAEMTADTMTLRLLDDGTPVDFARVPLPELDATPPPALGIFLLHATVDTVDYQTSARANVLTLTKRMLPAATQP